MKVLAPTDLRYAMYDGLFANMFATLTGGVFLTGFALHLGMNELMIGLLGSMPFLVTIFQLPASLFINQNGLRKRTAWLAALFARILWAPIVIVAFLPFLPSSARSHIILLLIFLSYSLATVSYIAWLSWMSDLVPDETRGRFFGTRNMFCGAAGMAMLLIFGKILDNLNGRLIGALPVGFGLVFMAAVFFGMLSLRFLKKISESPALEVRPNPVPLGRLLALPLSVANFRNFLAFSFLWSLSVYFVSPFFTLYFLRDLRFSYGFVALMAVLSALADLAGMQLWGRISDRVKNKAVIQFASWVAIFLPLAWVMVEPESVLIPVTLQVVGGGFWAGINLCVNNMLLRISQQENKDLFLSIFNIAGGLGATIGPILAGLVLVHLGDREIQLFEWKFLPIQVILMTSTLLRLLSFQLIRRVHEPEEATAWEVVRIIRSVRGLNVSSGFGFLLHPFVAVAKEEKTLP